MTGLLGDLGFPKEGDHVRFASGRNVHLATTGMWPTRCRRVAEWHGPGYRTDAPVTCRSCLSPDGRGGSGY